MLFKLKFILPLVLGLLISSAQAQTFQDGKDAAQRGDFEQAFDIWLSLSRRGDVSAQTSLAFLYKNGQGLQTIWTKQLSGLHKLPKKEMQPPRIC